MLPLPDGRALLRWMFWSLGCILLAGHDFVVQSLLHADRWASLLFPHDPARSALLVAAVHCYLIPTPLLCLATAFGLKRNKPWARWTGATASSLLLLGLPLLTVAGAVGLSALFAKPRRPDTPLRPAPRPPVEAAADPWVFPRDSRVRPIVFGIVLILGFQGLALLALYSQHAGMPAWNPGWTWCLYFLAFLLLQTALHELGHAVTAWTVYFRVRSLAIGPLIVWHNGYGYRCRLEWKRLLESNGYSGAVPMSGDNLPFKQIAIVAGGPAVSMVLGWLLLLLFPCLPGTAWQGWWWVVACNAVLGLCFAVMSLLPIGYSDGAILYHLIRDTTAGRQLLRGVQVSLVHEQAAAARSRGDFEKEVELRQDALELLRQCGAPNAAALAYGYQALGHALLACEDWPGAQAEFSRCLELATGCGGDAALLANAWSGLQKACVERHSVCEAERAAAAAASALAERPPKRDPSGLALARALLAQVHLRAAAYDAALAEAGAALALLPARRERYMPRAALHSVRAMAYLRRGATEEGLAAAREAAALLQSPETPEAERNLASIGLGDLAEGMWRAGESRMALDLMRQAVDGLESGGARLAAARCRIRMAAILRSLGRHAEALYALPDEETLPDAPRRALLAERAELHLAAGRWGAAVRDGRALLALWRSEPEPPAPELAVAQGLLARACLDAGAGGAAEAEAAALAREAVAVLAPWGHPDAASCRVTLALATREPSPAAFEEALGPIQSNPFLSPAERARRLAAERARIASRGPVEGTATLELAVYPVDAA